MYHPEFVIYARACRFVGVAFWLRTSTIVATCIFTPSSLPENANPTLILQLGIFNTANINLTSEKRKEAAENARLEEENERQARESGSMLEWLVKMQISIPCL